MENTQESEWETLPELYRQFRIQHPELALSEGDWALTNILRSTREKLVEADAIRKARKHWIGHKERFPVVLFDLLTGAKFWSNSMDEIQSRADMIGTPYVTTGQTADIAGISRVTLWRLPDAEKPKTFLMAGAQMLSIDDAVTWARAYWARQNAK